MPIPSKENGNAHFLGQSTVEIRPRMHSRRSSHTGQAQPNYETMSDKILYTMILNQLNISGNFCSIANFYVACHDKHATVTRASFMRNQSHLLNQIDVPRQ